MAKCRIPSPLLEPNASPEGACAALVNIRTIPLYVFGVLGSELVLHSSQKNSPPLGLLTLSLKSKNVGVNLGRTIVGAFASVKTLLVVTIRVVGAL